MGFFVPFSIVIVSVVIHKYYQYKSLKYFKDEYKLMKYSFLLHGFYFGNKYYSAEQGIKYRNKSVMALILGTILMVLCAIIFTALGI